MGIGQYGELSSCGSYFVVRLIPLLQLMIGLFGGGGGLEEGLQDL